MQRAFSRVWLDLRCIESPWRSPYAALRLKVTSISCCFLHPYSAMGEPTNGSAQLIVRWRMIILRVLDGAATCKSKCIDLKTQFCFRSVWYFQVPTYWYHFGYLYSQLFLAFKAQEYFKRRIRLPRVLCYIFLTVCSVWILHWIITWSQLSLEIVGSLILGRKMSCS